MKPVRLLLFSLGAFVLVCAAALGLALTPAVQRWAVLRTASGVPGLTLELAGVKAGWSGLTLRQVSAKKQDVMVTLDRLEADFSLLQLLVGRQLAISRLKVDGLVVDASRVSRTKAEAAAAGAPAAAPGLLAQVVLPVDLVLDDVRIAGRSLLPGAPGQPPIVAEFTVSGGRFRVGQEGALQLSATLRNPSPDAKVTTLRAQSGLRATLSGQRTLNNVSLTTVVDAEGRGLSGQSRLKISAELFRTASGESYLIGIDTILEGTTENVLQAQARLASPNRQYIGDWRVNVRQTQLEPFLLGRSWPDFGFNGGGHFSFDPHALAFQLQGDLRGQVSRLEAVEPAWRTLGPVVIETSFDVGQRDGILDVNRFKAVFSGEKPILEIRSLEAIRYDLRKRQLMADGSAAEKLLVANFTGLPVEWVQPFSPKVDVSGGNITGQIDCLRATGQAPVVALRGSLQAGGLNLGQGGRTLLTGANLTVQGEAVIHEDRLEVPALDLKVTTLASDLVTVSGKMAVQTSATRKVSVEARYSATANKLLARWLPGAPVTAQGDLKFEMHGERLEFSSGHMQIRQGAADSLLSASIIQPFTIGSSGENLVPREANQPVAKVELGRLPLGLLKLAPSGITLGGVVQQGGFELHAQDGKTIFRTTDVLKLADVSLTKGRRSVLSALSVEARPVIDYSPQSGLNIETGDVIVRNSARAVLATFKAATAQLPDLGKQATVTFGLEIPAWASQPFFTGTHPVSAGRASGEVRATLGPQSQVEARLTINGLRAGDSGQTFPVANLGFRGLLRSNGTISVQAPLLLDNAGRRSDLTFALEMSPLAEGYSIDGQLTGQQVELSDLLGLLGVFHASAAPDHDDRPAAAQTVAPDTAAAWSQFSGQLGLAITTVNQGDDWRMTELTGVVAIEPARLALPKLKAAFSETSRLEAKMEMRFTGGAMPYRLAGEYSLNDFDAGRLFRAIDPGKAPTVEGLFTVTGKITGNGETPARALDRVQGDLQLTSRQGIFRGLQRTSSKISITSKAVELGATVLGSILGSEKATRTAEKVAGQAYFIDQFAQSIGEFNYDLLSVHLWRDELLNMNLDDISLVSPEIRLNGRGEVTYEAGSSLLEQPLNVSLNFSARGKTEQLLDKLNALDGTKDELGYARTKSALTLDGTLTKPDPTAFFARLASAKLTDLLDNGD